MKLCKDCKHFSPFDEAFDREYQGEGAGSCSSEKFVYEDGSGRRPRTPNDGLSYWDYEGYLAGFSVGPNFGCIHWEPK